MIRVSYASESAPGRTSDDLFLEMKELVGVFDGVTKPAGLETGCIHGAAWYVDKLAAEIRALVDEQRKGLCRNGSVAHIESARSLPDLLTKAIDAVRGWHADGCDLTNPSTPAASLCLLQTVDARLEYLALCDTVLVLETDSGVQVITDDRFKRAMAQLPQERAGRELAKQTLTNEPHGYWIAAATPEAAQHALCGSFPLAGPGAVKRAVLLTDGASRAVDIFELVDWAGLLDLVADQGPDELIRRVRAAERVAPELPLRKRHDDATVALCHFE